MAAARQLPDLSTTLDYETWLDEVGDVLTGMDVDMDLWQENWAYDFRCEYEAGTPADIAATRAHDFWWQSLLAESWT